MANFHKSHWNASSFVALNILINKMRIIDMANNAGGGKGLYFIVGALVVAVAVMAYFLFAPSEKPDLAIDIGDTGIEVETN